MVLVILLIIKFYFKFFFAKVLDVFWNLETVIFLFTFECGKSNFVFTSKICITSYNYFLSSKYFNFEL